MTYLEPTSERSFSAIRDFRFNKGPTAPATTRQPFLIKCLNDSILPDPVILSASLRSPLFSNDSRLSVSHAPFPTSPVSAFSNVKLSSCVTSFVTSVTGFVTPYRVEDEIL